MPAIVIFTSNVSGISTTPAVQLPSQACTQAIIQASPVSMTATWLLVGNASGQFLGISVGGMVTLPVSELSTVYVKTASAASGTVVWLVHTAELR